jgi:creatinine amidohydrolase
MTPGILAEMCDADFDNWKPEVALIPVGSTEVHARHLPFGSDTLQVEAICRRTVEAANTAGARILLLPAIPFSVDGNLMKFPYTIHVPPSTLMMFIRDIINSLNKHGIQKFLLVNGHGGNTATLQTVCRELYGGPFIATIDWWKIAWDVTMKIMETGEPDHADEFETSVVQALQPKLARMDVVEKTQTREHMLPKLVKYGGNFSRPWEGHTRNGGTGDPTKATVAKGEAIVQESIARFTEILIELNNAPMGEAFPY